MSHSNFSSCAFVMIAGIILGISGHTAQAQDNAALRAEQARAVFKKRCVSCHSESQSRGGLDMTSLESILAGSTSGAVVEPGKPSESLLFTLAAHIDTPKMPPNAPKISERELKAISNWIEGLSQEATSTGLGGVKPEVPNVQDKGRSNRNLDGLAPIATLPGPLCITALASSTSLLAVSGLHQVLLYDLASGKWKGALPFPEGDIFALKFSSDGSRLFAAGGLNGSSGSVVCWDANSDRRLRTMSIEDDAVLAMDVSSDGKLLAVGGPRRTIEVFNLTNGERVHVFKKHADWVTSLTFSQDGVLLASGDRFGSIYLWDVHDGTQFDTAQSHAEMVTSLKFNRDTTRLWSAGKDGFIRQWDIEQNKAISSWRISEKGIADLIITPDRMLALEIGKRLFDVHQDGSSAVLASFENRGIRCVSTGRIDAPARIVVGDCLSTLHWIDDSGTAHQTIKLPQERLQVVTTRATPTAVARELQIAEALDAKFASREATLEAAITQTKEALTTSRKHLENARKSLADLEEQIRELEERLQRINGK